METYRVTIQWETNQTTPSISSILMFGNSYTQANALDTLIEEMIDTAGGNTSVDAQTGGGMTSLNIIQM